MPSARPPRIAFFAYATTLLLEMALGLWSRHLVAGAEETHDFRSIDKLLDVIGYGYTALGVASVVALVGVAGGLRAATGSRVAIGAAVATGLGVAVELVQRVFLSLLASGSGADRIDAILKVSGAAMVLAFVGAEALVVVVATRVGRAAAARATVPVAVVTFVVLGVHVATYVAGLALGRRTAEPPVLSTIHWIAYYASTFLVAVAAIHAGWTVARIREEASPAAQPAASAASLSPGWRSAANGIGLYLGGAAGRIACALLGYAAMASASGATSTSELHGVHDSVLVVAVLSGVASLVMLAGVGSIARSPPDTGGTGAALIALLLMILGVLLDLATTSITLDALGGNLSAAFFAMDALPYLAATSALLGVGAGVSLLRSFGNMAHALGAEDLRARANGATMLLIIGGTVAGLAALGLQHMPVEVLGLVAIVVLPVAIAALVQFLRVAVPLGRAIRTGLALSP
jgi:hypothetical protein